MKLGIMILQKFVSSIMSMKSYVLGCISGFFLKKSLGKRQCLVEIQLNFVIKLFSKGLTSYQVFKKILDYLSDSCKLKSRNF